ncbi:hypothetical protein OPQ81_007468 [Rhizoctonia solani]|nr:hypothetical protein OPQ81_007468 [Rhizoctonia solani]
MLPRLDDFIHIILNQTVLTGDPRVLDFRPHVRRLDVEQPMNEQQLETLGRALPTLQNLEHLRWDVWRLADSGVQWHDTLVFLHRELPKLRSLSLIMAQNEIVLVVSLSRLQELEIDFDGVTSDEIGDDIELPNTLVELVRGASNIESLSLSFEEDYERGAAPWASLSLFSALSSDTFPNLRRLSATSSRFGPNDEDFQQFIRKHGKLEKIVLNTGAYDPNWWDGADLPPMHFATQFVEELMPSIRHFGGPGCFVGPLLNSNLSSQLEVLELIEPACEEFGTVSQLLQEIGNSITPELPCLRELAISIDAYKDHDSNISEWGKVLSALSRVADRMQVLEELLINTWQEPSPDELEELFELLNRLTRLRRLAVHAAASDSPSLRDELQALYERTKICYPQLQIVNNSQPASF